MYYSADTLGVMDAFLRASKRGGTVVIDNDAEHAEPISLRRTAGVRVVSERMARLTYTGSGPCGIDLASSSFFQAEGVTFLYSHAAFKGDLIRFGHDPAHPADPMYWNFKRCHFSGVDGPLSARSHVNLSHAICGGFEDCLFTWADRSILGAYDAYANAISFTRCTFAINRQAPILNPSQSWVFHNCTFEPRVSLDAAGRVAKTHGIAGAIETLPGASGQMPYAMGVTVDGCWFGDVSVPGGTWMRFYGGGLNVRGSMIGGAGKGGASIEFLPHCRSAVVQGNRFEGGPLGMRVSGPMSSLATLGNDFADNVAAIEGQSRVQSFHAEGNCNGPKVKKGLFGWF